MNTYIARKLGVGGYLVMLSFLALLLSACANTPLTHEGAIDARNKLTALQNDPNLRDRARVEIRDAEQAVSLAEVPVSKKDEALGEHRVYMAERKIAIAEATANTNYAVAQRAHLGEERDAARLRARTQEADRARADANQARNAQALSSSESALQAAELQKRIAELEAEATDRGLVLTLGDVLFATGSAELRGGANTTLDKLVTFLNEYPERKVVIEGHTDNVGSSDYNQGLSQRRADAVRSYLSQQGIASTRMSSVGLGMAKPISSNNDSTGRQQNRRVEIVIEHASRT